MDAPDRSFGFEPDSIAVVGASTDPGKLAGRPVRYLLEHGFPGSIYPVNPSADEIAGLECYSTIEAIPGQPDLAMLMLPADIVSVSVEECLEAGITDLIVVSSGFAETGEAAAVAAEEHLVELAESHDASLVGPNSQGVIDVPTGLAASFTPALARDDLIEGGVSFVTQSGAFGGALTTLLQERGIGLNRWVSTGNEAMLGALDFAHLLVDDPGTDVLAGYIEGFEDGRKLVALRRTTAGIDLPVVLLKVGRSDQGKAAARSHTATVAGSHAVYESIFRETGVIGVSDVDAFVDVVEVLTRFDNRPGNRLGVISTSGGAGVHIADVAREVGFELPLLEGETRAGIDGHIPAYGTARNPVDVTAQVAGSPPAFTECLTLLLDDAALDVVVLQLTNIGGDRASAFGDRIAAAADNRATPLAVCWTGGTDKTAGVERLVEAGIPVFENPARCVRALGHVADFATAAPRLEAARELPAHLAGPGEGDHPRLLTEHDGKALLAEYGIDVPAGELVQDPAAGTRAADRFGYPVVAKLVSPDLHHRAEADGVRRGLHGPQAVRAACEDLLAVAADEGIALEGLSIQRQVPASVELALGITDTDFGPVVMVGRGGSDIETTDDTAYRTIPVVREQAESMFGELETIPFARFDPPTVERLVAAIMALSDVYMDNQWIRTADVNPIVVTGDRVVAVDALFLA